MFSKEINGMSFERIDEIWDANLNGTIYYLVEPVVDKVSNSHPQIINKTSGYLQREVFEVAQELLYTYGMIWGKIWTDAGFGTLSKENHEWIIKFDEDDERFLTQSVIDKYIPYNVS